MSNSNQRQNSRITANLPVEISIGSQITIQGQLKDLSLKSAFIKMKSSVYMQINDELNFLIKCSHSNEEDCVDGTARISRISAGEGIAIYFVQMNENSSSRLQQLVGA